MLQKSAFVFFVGLTLSLSSFSNPDKPTVRFKKDEMTVKEGESFKIDLVMDFPVSWQVKARVKTSKASADSGGDYHCPGQTVTFPPGKVRASMKCVTFADNYLEPDEYFEAEIVGATWAKVGNPNEMKVIIQDIVDDDSAVSIGFDGPFSENIPENIGNFLVSVSLERAVQYDVQFTVNHSGSATGDGVDYDCGDENNFIMPAHQTTYELNCVVTDDDHGEPNEFIQFTLMSPDADATSNNSLVRTIVDDD